VRKRTQNTCKCANVQKYSKVFLMLNAKCMRTRKCANSYERHLIFDSFFGAQFDVGVWGVKH